MNKKAVALLSGGLDSILAIKLMLEQRIDVHAINFLTVFCTCTRKGCTHAATQASQTLDVPLEVVNISEEYLEIIRKPKHGYGSNMNPCIDCRILIFKKARDYMSRIGASFIVTGEVLGERPMSQRRDAIFLIEKEAGLKGLILRPLSAKMFEPTMPEMEGIVDREKLLAISGRSRRPQIALAQKFSIDDYPCPAGGCLLTDPQFARRVRDLLEHNELTLDNVMLLKLGRHFRLTESAKLIVGRDEDENRFLESLARPDDLLFKLKDLQGPLSILRGKSAESLMDFAAKIAAHHTKYRDNGMIRVDYWPKGSSHRNTLSIEPAGIAEIERLRI